MLFSLSLLILSTSTLVASHGRIDMIIGDQGGNTTALGILGGVVPLEGANAKTEIDTTVFKHKAALTNGLGHTIAGGHNKVNLTSVQALSGSTLPQISSDGSGSISGIVHIITTDGAGPYTAVLDTTGDGKFKNGTELAVTQQVPGNRGNIKAPCDRRFVRRMLVKMGLVKRAKNVNESYAFAANVPAGVECTGSVEGVQGGVCLVKIVNPSGAGPFGGVVAVQMATASAAVDGLSGGVYSGRGMANSMGKRRVYVKFKA